LFKASCEKNVSSDFVSGKTINGMGGRYAPSLLNPTGHKEKTYNKYPLYLESLFYLSPTINN